MTLVSVIIPTYNSADTLWDTLLSVENQTLDDLEIIIVDDSSSDDTVRLINKFKEYSNRTVRTAFNSKNEGVAMTRNVGISMSRGEYVAFLDSDDIWLPDKLKMQVSKMMDRGIAFSFTNYETMDHEGTPLKARKLPAGRYSLDDFLKGNPAGLLTVVVKRSVIPDNLFPDAHHEDYAAWIMLIRKVKYAFLFEESHAKYRIHNSLSSNKIKSMFWTFNVLRNFGGLHGLSLMIGFLNYILRVLGRE